MGSNPFQYIYERARQKIAQQQRSTRDFPPASEHEKVKTTRAVRRMDHKEMIAQLEAMTKTAEENRQRADNLRASSKDLVVQAERYRTAIGALNASLDQAFIGQLAPSHYGVAATQAQQLSGAAGHFAAQQANVAPHAQYGLVSQNSILQANTVALGTAAGPPTGDDLHDAMLDVMRAENLSMHDVIKRIHAWLTPEQAKELIDMLTVQANTARAFADPPPPNSAWGAGLQWNTRLQQQRNLIPSLSTRKITP